MPVIGTAKFNRTVRKLGRLLPVETMRETVVSLGFDLLSEIVLRTPVDTGYHRNNWQVTLGAPATKQVGSPDDEINDQGSGAVNRGFAVLKSAPPFGIVYFTNNAPAIEVLELGLFVPKNPGPSKSKKKGRTGKILVRGGFTVQAPQGMVKPTLDRATIRLDAIIAQLQDRVSNRLSRL